MRPATLAVRGAGLLLLVWTVPAAADQLDLSNVYRGGVARDGMVVADRLIVHFTDAAIPQIALGKDGLPSTDRAELNAVNRRFGVRALDRLFPTTTAQARAQGLVGVEELDRVFTVDFDASHTLSEAVAAYQALPGVTRVEPVGIHKLDAVVPNDPLFPSQIWLRGDAAGARDIRAIAGWFHSAGDSNVVLAVGDSGVDWQHPDLGGSGPQYARGNIWINWREYNGVQGQDDDGNGFVDDLRGWDFITGVTGEQTPPQDVSVPDNDPMDYEGHGTSVAGCIAAIGNNSVGVVGGAWRCKVMPLRVGWLPLGQGIGVVRMDFAASAISYAVVKGARVFNASWGSSDSGGLGSAVNFAVANNMVVVTAAGNDNTDSASYLGSRTDVIAVAAVTASDAKASFSSFGAWVEVCAPGTSTLTTAYNRVGTGGMQHAYGSPSGTSFASPITCSVAGVIISAFPGLTGAQVRTKLIASVDEVDSRNPGFAGLLGSGRVSLAKVFNDHRFKVPLQLPTMLDAINTADLHDTVAVQGGVSLDERVLLQAKPLLILGGYNAGFTARDPINNKSTLGPTAGEGAVLRANAPVDSSVIVDGFRITGGSASDQPFEPLTGKYGGGVLIKGGAPKLRNLLITGNQGGGNFALGNGGGGGGGIAVLGGTPIFEDCEVTANSGLLGGGLYVHHGSPSFRRVNFHDNIAYPGDGFTFSPDGGAVYLVDTNAKRAEQVSFYGGRIGMHLVQGRGGAIYSTNSNIMLRGVTIEDNGASGSGAAIYLTGGSIDGKNDVVRHNSRTGSGSTSGGGLYASGAAVNLDGELFESNSASFGGAGLYLDNCPNASLTRVVSAKNSASLLGGGVHANACSGLTLTNCTVAGNTGAAAGGNGVYIAGSTATLSHCIFAQNGNGGTSIADGAACQSSTVTFSCNLAFGNTAGNYGGCADPTGTNGNAVGDPLFCGLATGDYRLSPSSPAAPAHSNGCGLIGGRDATCSGVDVEDHPALPTRLSLAQNVPNPFNPRTTIRFTLPVAGAVRVQVHDLRGRVVRTLIDGTLDAGGHDVLWDGLDELGQPVASGVYFYSVASNGEREVRKMGLLR